MSKRPTPSSRKRKADSEDLRATADETSVTAPSKATPPPNSKKPRDLVNPPIDDTPKVILSRAERRKLKKPSVVVTAEMREEAKERKKELRRHLRMLKSNGARRKVKKLEEKRQREESEVEDAMNAFDSGFRPISKGRRFE